ncbi:hypothetical protein SLEP1_g16608 [Rubroshorea leprosula]|uniref:Retrotransposon gag domain-containing protein n=1 Tax=Rubroshorea leprosula TaxID=152421 RepID=A0AAV5J0M7_9ROSI|nr:hypothetical protein SLEP1_g16608 [Rubroshorea leprosula]
MQQQFGVFQLVLAQLLARNSLDDPLINLLNPAHPIIPHQQQQPVNSPIRSIVPPKSASQLQSHFPPLPPNPPQPVASDEPYPSSFRMPQFETYDGTKDPDDHLHAFYSIMQAHNASDALMCKIFPSTLCGNAQTWFNDVVLEIDLFDQAMGIAIITQGLGHERFRNSLIKHPPASFEEVNKRSRNFITTEEYVLSQKPLTIKDNRSPTWREERPSKNKFKAIQNQGPFSTAKVDKPGVSSSQIMGRQPTWTACTLLRDHTKYCDYHQDHSHITEACNMLKFELESLARKGMLNEFIPNKDHSTFVREQHPKSQGPQGAGNKMGVRYQQPPPPPPLPTPATIIHMINGGLEAAGMSSKQQKLYVREVRH